MSSLRVAYPRLFCLYVVVAGEVCMRRTHGILKTYGHKYRTLYLVSEVLYIEVTESLVEVLICYASFLGSLEDPVSWPIYESKIVLVVVKERR